MKLGKNFGYCDANFERIDNGKKITMPWERMLITSVPQNIVGQSGAFNCYFTVQRYKEAISKREVSRAIAHAEKYNAQEDLVVETRRRMERKKGQVAWESDEGKLLRQYMDELRGMKEPEEPEHISPLYFDFDCDPKTEGIELEKAIAKSQKDCQKLAEHFTKMGIPEPQVQIWFSGSKGFHLTVRPEVFSIRPSRFLNRIIKLMAGHLRRKYSLSTLDMKVYTVARMWRIPGTLHPKTNNYKIELTHTELNEMVAQQIIEASKQPRGYLSGASSVANSVIHKEELYEDIESIPEWQKYWQGYAQLWEMRNELQNLQPNSPIRPPNDGKGEHPVCMQDLETGGPKPGRNRNETLVPMVSFYYDAGYSREQAERIVRDWTEEHFSGDKKARQDNGLSVINAAYEAKNMHFVCKFIRSKSGGGDNGAVRCVGKDNCSWIADPKDQDQSHYPLVQLAQASKPGYHDATIRIPVNVIAVGDSPYQVPIRGKAACEPSAEAKICEKCPNGFEGACGKLEWNFSSEDRETLSLFAVNDKTKIGTIKEKLRIPERCGRVTYETTENMTVEEIQIAPMVDFAQDVEDEGDMNSSEFAQNQAKHVVRTGFHVGHGIETNKKYIIEARVVSHPTDQGLCFLFSQKESAQSDIESFEMTPGVYEKLCEFQPEPGQSVAEKFNEIHQDFVANVHNISGRPDLAIAVDLCYHSVIGYTLFGKKENKGWFELLVVGDTGTGKSTLVKRMSEHFGLGEMIAGEGAKRTALISSNIQMRKSWVIRWGKMPQNDRRLLVIDEFGDMKEEEIGQLTQVRSSGIAEGLGVNSHYQTFARTRLICITNPVQNNGSLQGYGRFGVEAVRGIYKMTQDLRRVDLAVIADKTDVSHEETIRRWDKEEHEHKYTTGLCRSLILWIWSRTPRDISFTQDGGEAIDKHTRILVGRYDCDISLTEKSDFKMKLARISAAVAARMFSTDEEGKKVYIRACHVEFAAMFMDECYRKPTMAFWHYAKAYREKNTLTGEKKKQILLRLKEFEDPEHLIMTLSDMNQISKAGLIDILTYDRGDIDKLWKFLTVRQLIVRHARFYKKTAAFSKLLQEQDGARFSTKSSSIIWNAGSSGTEEEFSAGDVPRDENAKTGEPDF